MRRQRRLQQRWCLRLLSHGPTLGVHRAGMPALRWTDCAGRRELATRSERLDPPGNVFDDERVDVPGPHLLGWRRRAGALDEGVVEPRVLLALDARLATHRALPGFEIRLAHLIVALSSHDEHRNREVR